MGILVYRDHAGAQDLVGRIDYVRGLSATFSYDSAYLRRARASGELGISERIPLDPRPYSAAEMGPFFRGLLPEGEVYGNLAEMYQVSRNDYLSVLEQLGCESIGALTFVSEGIDASEYEPRYEELSENLVHALQVDPVRAATGEANSTRLSLSGAQSKVAWYLPEGADPATASTAEWLVPHGTAPSNYIIKVSRRGEEPLAGNERACALIAQACGIEIAEVNRLADVPGAIAIRRYDRAFMGSGAARKLVRMHQEDFCQALGLAPYFKYQPDSGEGDYIVYAADLIDATSSNPHADRVEFAKRLAFNFALGNSDAHLKNSALLYNQSWTGRRLAPLYDVTCIPLTGYSTKMPFVIGKHRELSEIDEQDILSIALDMGIGLEDWDEALRRVIDGIASCDPTQAADDADTMTRILENAAPRVAVLKRCCG